MCSSSAFVTLMQTSIAFRRCSQVCGVCTSFACRLPTSYITLQPTGCYAQDAELLGPLYAVYSCPAALINLRQQGGLASMIAYTIDWLAHSRCACHEDNLLLNDCCMGFC